MDQCFNVSIWSIIDNITIVQSLYIHSIHTNIIPSYLTSLTS